MAVLLLRGFLHRLCCLSWVSLVFLLACLKGRQQDTRHVRVSERSKGEINPIGTVQRSHRLQIQRRKP